MGKTSLVEINNLSTHFFVEKEVIKAVNGVSLDIKKNTTVGLVGESGCGKSILAMSLLKIFQSPPGKIVEGKINFYSNDEVFDIVNLDSDSIQLRKLRSSDIGFIFQEPMSSLNPLFKIGKQITEKIKINEKIDNKSAIEKSKQLLKRVGINDVEYRMNQYPHHFSGGMRQRVMIAIAIASNPKLLIADEPTTALDVTIQAEILNLIKELKEEFQTSVLFITHNFGVISKIADEIAVMYLGRIIEKGKKEDIFNNPKHPYTIGLLNSVPRFGMHNQEIPTIPGIVPSPTEDIEGCYFYNRCNFATNNCKEKYPDKIKINNNHYAFCNNLQEMPMN